MNRPLYALLVVATVSLAAVTPLAGQTECTADRSQEVGLVTDRERMGDQEVEYSDQQGWRVRQGDAVGRVVADRDTPVNFCDILGLRYPWVLRVELAMPGGGFGMVALAADSRAESGPVVLGPQGDEGTFEVRESPFGGSRIHLMRGALFLKNWPAGEEACMVASGACALNLGTSYLMHVDAAGRAYLGITEEAVEIRWWNGLDEPPPPMPEQEWIDCDDWTEPDEGERRPCLMRVAAGDVMSWTVTEPPAPWPLTVGFAALEEAVDRNGDDIWDDSLLKKPLFWITSGAVITVATCLIWWCDNDVTGTVIINP